MRTLSQHIGAERIIDKRPMKAQRLTKTEYSFGLAGKILDHREDLSDKAHRMALAFVEEVLNKFIAYDEPAGQNQVRAKFIVLEAIQSATKVDADIILEILKAETYLDADIKSVQEAKRRKENRERQRYNAEKEKAMLRKRLQELEAQK